MNNIIVSDIFGKTPALIEIASRFSQSVEIFDPYNSEIMDFKDENEAYAYFSTEVGLDTYANNLLYKLKSLAGEISLLGFSVGASAIWKISCHQDLANVTGAKCFYGSQIRYYTEINPLFHVQAIFPSTEPHFSVLALISDLSEKENVEIYQVASLHGFMNRYSQNYDPTSYHHFMAALCDVAFNKPIQATVFCDA